ncbi:hypothetical protein [Deinococcus sedimenti]|uniref:Uncharacterized protein n=1 Tax=Deinococcus sedimenti TaxID=1867090 RepID=A0ABQ2S609_9DEIO|nr:hypothetical protein [Deinococcus sedimenti]GGR92702.1 hypothetical protein GCM10008960_19590 [Deinococcus sedimenti]
MNRCAPLLLALLLSGGPVAAQRWSAVPPEWTALAAQPPGFAGTVVDVAGARPRVTVLSAGGARPPTDQLGEEARTAARAGVLRVGMARFTLAQNSAALREVGGAGRFDPLLNRVLVPPGRPAHPSGVTVTPAEVDRDSRLSVFVRPTSPARGPWRPTCGW